MTAIHKKGFTMIEMMIVLAILLTMTALIVPQVVNAIESSKVTADQASVRSLNTATAIYRSTDPNNDPFIDESSSNTELIEELVTNGYLFKFIEPQSKDASFKWLFSEEKWALITANAQYIVSSADGLIIVTSGGHLGYLKGDYTNEDILDIVIPVSLDDQMIKNIWQDVFRDKGIESITFAQGSQIVQIHARAFYNNHLTSIDLPDTIEKIDLWSFKDNNLSEIKLPSSLKVIEQRAFEGNDLTKIKIGSNVETIKDRAFGEYTNSFIQAYETGGAGTYVLDHDEWIKQ